MASDDVQNQEFGIWVLLQTFLNISKPHVAGFEIRVMHNVGVLRIGGTVMLHAFFKSVDVVCTGRQITHELLFAFLARHLWVFNGIEYCAAEVN